MKFLFFILLLAVLGYLALRIIEAVYGPRTCEDEIHLACASDGWRLALHRYRPRGENPHGEPVLLHHGLSANHAGFDLGVGTAGEPVPSLAHWLARRGYDVWVCDLRGRRPSDVPVPFSGRRWGWAMDDYLEKDDPAFVDHILAQSGFQQLHWIGHSMGGILHLCYCAKYGSPKVASGVTVGSAFQYGGAGSAYEPLLSLLGLARFIKRVPLGTMSKLWAPFAAIRKTHISDFNVWLSNVAPAAVRAVHAGVINDVSVPELAQLATLFTGDGITSLDGKTHFAGMAANVRTPTLLLAGDRDIQCPAPVVKRTHAMMKGDHKFEEFGKERGLPDHYAHFDMLIGLRAEQEVYPVILNWLQKHPAKRKA